MPHVHSELEEIQQRSFSGERHRSKLRAEGRGGIRATAVAIRNSGHAEVCPKGQKETSYTKVSYVFLRVSEGLLYC